MERTVLIGDEVFMENGTKEIALEYFRRLSDIATASFHEGEICSEIKNILVPFELKVSADEWGNLYVESLLQNDNTPVVFVAHMDHPAFEVVEKSGERLKIKVLGGHSKHVATTGLKLKVIADNLQQIPASISCVEQNKDKDKPTANSDWLAVDCLEARLDQNIDIGNLPRPVILDLPPFEIDYGKEFIWSRSADDLAGCAAILAAITQASKSEFSRPITALFTRAEEVGLIGARLAAQSGKLNNEVMVYSIETSSEIDGVKIGDGPVIRVGDKMTTFHNGPESLVRWYANQVSEHSASFKYQRSLMDAGTCEGSAFASYGYNVSGIAFPLGNWHNRGKNSVEMEYISMNDYFNGVSLLYEMMTAKSPIAVKNSFPKISENIKNRLKQSH